MKKHQVLDQMLKRHPDWGIAHDITAAFEPGGLVLDSFRNCYHGVIRPWPQDRDWPLRQWFFGWAATDTNAGHAGCDAVFLARGRDLGTWQVHTSDGWDAHRRPDTWAPVLTPTGAHPWDQWHNGDPSVVIRDGLCHMAYSATGFNLDGLAPGHPDDADGDLAAVAGATSVDGITWERNQSPLVISELDLGRSAMRYDGIGPDQRSPRGYFARPALLLDGDRWRLWFDLSYEGWRWDQPCVGYAEAPVNDFATPGAFAIHHLPPENPVRLPFWNPEVIAVDEVLLAFGDPLIRPAGGWEGRALAMAVSVDGVAWTVVGQLHPERPRVTHVPTAHLEGTGADRRLVLLYATQRGGDPYDYRYDAIRWAHLPLPEGGAIGVLDRL